jgi:MHS family proline/betaine transporter-like MFS transporter
MKKSLTLRIIAASSLGTILEWYDFSLFAFLTPVISKLFFPQQNGFTALLLTYAIFAMGYFVRPIGAMIFGHFGDRVGRNKTLVWSILLMSLPTFLMGLLPSYQTIGIAAPCLLILLRISQGIAVGGETTGSVLFALESTGTKRRGFLGGLLWAMSGVGMLLGSFAAMLVSHAEHITWAWRVPFLLGIITGLIGYFLRRHTLESILFAQALEEKSIHRFPLLKGIKDYKFELFNMIGIYVLSAMTTYLVFIFMPTFASTIIGMPLAKTTTVTTLAYLAVTLLVPFGGYLSDRVHRTQCMKWAAIGFIFLSYPLFTWIASGNIHHFIFAECVFVLLAACYQGSLNAAIFDLIPTSIRYSMTAVSYNISYSLFGGTAPFVATYLVHLSGNHSVPGWYLTAGGLVAFLALNRMESRKNSLYVLQTATHPTP